MRQMDTWLAPVERRRQIEQGVMLIRQKRQNQYTVQHGTRVSDTLGYWCGGTSSLATHCPLTSFVDKA